MGVTIDRSGVNKWRYTCPHGHIRWEPREDSIWCVSCKRSAMFESNHQRIIDQRQRTELPRDKVRVE